LFELIGPHDFIFRRYFKGFKGLFVTGQLVFVHQTFEIFEIPKAFFKVFCASKISEGEASGPHPFRQNFFKLPAMNPQPDTRRSISPDWGVVTQNLFAAKERRSKFPALACLFFSTNPTLPKDQPQTDSHLDSPIKADGVTQQPFFTKFSRWSRYAEIQFVRSKKISLSYHLQAVADGHGGLL